MTDRFDVDAAAERLARLRETWCSTDEFYPFTTADEQRSVHGDREDAMNLLAQALALLRTLKQWHPGAYEGALVRLGREETVT